MSTAQLLQSAGLRRTRARRVVLELLNRADRPLSHQEIAGTPETRRLDRVTLCRTSTSLQEAGVGALTGIDHIRPCGRQE